MNRDLRGRETQVSARVGWRRGVAAFVVAIGGSLAVSACQEELPVGIADGPLPGTPVTVQVTLPWSQFASNLEVFGGYGSAEDLGEGVLANQFEGSLDARTLIRFATYPSVATVRDTSGTNRPDSSLTFVSGRLVTFFDTIASTNSGVVNLSLGATTEEWDASTASWTLAIDTINDERPWSEVGGGLVTAAGTSTWDPTTGDSAVFALDSATVAAWRDSTDLSVGARLDLLDPGERLSIRSVALRLDARPSSRPDTIVELSAGTRGVTFIYAPFPDPPPDGVRIGGTPSWRTVMDIAIPEVLDGIPELCAVVSCPHQLDPVQISFGALVLTSRAPVPAFQPTDSIRLDVRPVFDRPSMPKSPLGNTLLDELFGRPVPPEAFGVAAGLPIEIPFTTFARDVLRGTDLAGNEAPGTLALLSVIEPFSISYASFEGPGSAAEPYLKLVLTIGPPVELP